MSVLEASRKMTSREQTAYDLGFHEGQNAAVVHGRWVAQEYSGPEGKYYLFHCSECGIPNAFERNYCPNCGAKMDGDGNV